MNRSHMLGLALSALFITESASAYSSLIFVRHAEKKEDGSKDPGLTDEGVKRAENLHKMLKDSGVTSIYTSEMQRTQKTAEPIAKALKISSTAISAKETDKFIQTLKNDKSEGVALIVGHSNTVPELIKALGVTQSLSIGEKEFDRLFILSAPQTKNPILTSLRY